MQTTPEGLVTLALLKTRFDQGHDHLEFVEPFVADAVRHIGKDSFLPADVVDVVRDRCDLLLPSDTVKTVLGRFTRRGQLRREGGQFLDPELPDVDLESVRKVEQARIDSLGEGLSEFAKGEGADLGQAEALVAMAQFISLNKVPLVLKEDFPDSPLDHPEMERATMRLVARFITQRCLDSETLSSGLRALTDGMVLQDTLLLRDVRAPPERFRNLTVILDTPILLAALDLHGEADGLATREFLSLVRESGATTIAFDRTVSEIRRILAAYESLLGSPGGRLRLYPTELTHHVLTHRLGPSDIRVISSTLERRLGRIAIPIRELPDRDRRFTLDEGALAKALSDETGDVERHRIIHDVNAIASTLTLRRGRRATVLERAHAIFCTTSGSVIRNAQAWYRGQGEHDVPPIVHQYALSSIAWFKKPRATANVKLHELAALCGAALRPTPETWERFIENLEALRDDGTISDDEAVAIVASELTEPFLARIDDSGEPDADTIRDVIDRVRAKYKTEAASDSRAVIESAEAAAQRAREHARALEARYVAIEAAASRKAAATGRLVAWLVSAVLAILVVGAAVISFFDIGFASTPFWHRTAQLVVGGSVILATYSQIRGPSVSQIHDRVADSVASRVRRFLLPTEVQPGATLHTGAQVAPSPERTDMVGGE